MLRVLGQVIESYIITEGPDGDLSGGSARRSREDPAGADDSRLACRELSPRSCYCSPYRWSSQWMSLKRFWTTSALCETIGFELEEFGDSTILVRAMPGVLAAQTRPQPLRELLLRAGGS